MRAIAASVLTFEALIVLLAIPVAITLGRCRCGRGDRRGVALAVLLVASLGRSPGRGATAGWVIQGLVLACGFVVTAMFVLGGLFAVLWVVGLRVGRRGEELQAERWAGIDDPPGADRGRRWLESRPSRPTGPAAPTAPRSNP